jgi:hypothetical protein
MSSPNNSAARESKKQELKDPWEVETPEDTNENYESRHISYVDGSSRCCMSDGRASYTFVDFNPLHYRPWDSEEKQ